MIDIQCDYWTLKGILYRPAAAIQESCRIHRHPFFVHMIPQVKPRLNGLGLDNPILWRHTFYINGNQRHIWWIYLWILTLTLGLIYGICRMWRYAYIADGICFKSFSVDKIMCTCVDTMRPKQNSRDYADNIFKQFPESKLLCIDAYVTDVCSQDSN